MAKEKNKFSDYKLELTKVKSDGRCAYRSIAKHLFKNQSVFSKKNNNQLDENTNQELSTLLLKDDKNAILQEPNELKLDKNTNQELLTLLFKDYENGMLQEQNELKLADLLKKIALEHIKKHRDKIEPAVLKVALADAVDQRGGDASLESFIEHHKKEAQYADQVILRALSQVLRINICTISTNNSMSIALDLSLIHI